MLRPSVVVHEETIPEGGALIVGLEGVIIGLIVEGWGMRQRWLLGCGFW